MPRYRITIDEELRVVRKASVVVTARDEAEAEAIADDMCANCVYPKQMMTEGFRVGAPLDFDGTVVDIQPWNISIEEEIEE